jgi:hypothetical protein
MRKWHSCRRRRAAAPDAVWDFRTRTSSPFSPLPERLPTKSRCAFALGSCNSTRGYVPAIIAPDPNLLHAPASCMLTAYPCVARRTHACYHQRHTILIPVAAVSGLESVAQQVACATTSLQQAWLSADTSLLGYGTEERQIAPGPGGTPTIQVDPMTPPSPPEARPRPVVLVAAASVTATSSATATSDGRVDGRMGLAAAAPVVCSSTPVGSQPLGNRPLVLPSNPKRGANGPLAQEQAAALVQAAAIRAAQAASTSYDQPPSKRPMYKARGMAPRGLTQSTGPVYASCRETRARASSTPLSLPSSLRGIPICLMCIAWCATLPSCAGRPACSTCSSLCSRYPLRWSSRRRSW